MIYIAYQCSDLFYPPFSVSVFSLLKNHKGKDEIKIFIVSKDFSLENLSKIHHIQKSFGQPENAEIIPLPNLKSKEWGLCFNTYNGKWSLDSFEKMCLTDLLPSYVDKVLYLDSDTLICKDIADLWNTNLDGNYVAAACDFISKHYYNLFGLSDIDYYINSGVLLWNLSELRKIHFIDMLRSYLVKNQGFVFFAEQTAISVLCRGKIKKLPLSYNSTTILYQLTPKNIFLLRKPYNSYSEEEIINAKENCTIMHMTTCFLTNNRCWFSNSNCKNKPIFNSYADQTPEFQYSQDNRKLKKRLIDFFVLILPKTFVCWLVGKYYNKKRISKYVSYKKKTEK